MRNIVITLEYDGIKFKGWQKQPNTKTIQNDLEKVLSKILSEDIEVVGSGRTDTNVSAYGQVANFKTNNDTVSLKGIKMGVNSKLRGSLAITKISEVDLEFNSRFDAKKKTYVYILNENDYYSALNGNHEYYVGKKLDIGKMQEAAKYLVGTHDFKGFKSSGSPKKTTVRTIYSLEVKKIDRGLFKEKKEENSRIAIKITGNGFLYNMVRIISGTLLEVGLGKIKPTKVLEILETKDRTKAGKTLPGNGLILYNVEY